MENNKKINLNTILLSIVIVLLVVVVILFAMPEKNTNNSEGVAEPTIVPMDEKIDLTDIETPYGKLQFPTERYQYLKLEEKEENHVFAQTYYCVIDGTELELYTVYFGENSDSDEFGYIEKDGQKIRFGIYFSEASKPDGWSDDQYYIAKVMLEDVNFIIESVTGRSDYTKTK